MGNFLITKHLIFARKGTPAGYYYNQKTINEIHKIISTQIGKRPQFDFFQMFREFLNKKFGKFFTVEFYPDGEIESATDISDFKEKTMQDKKVIQSDLFLKSKDF